MPGHLQQHPYQKTYDELIRSINRMQVYLNTLPPDADAERETVGNMLKELESAAIRVPAYYRITKGKWQYDRKKQEGKV